MAAQAVSSPSRVLLGGNAPGAALQERPGAARGCALSPRSLPLPLRRKGNSPGSLRATRLAGGVRVVAAKKTAKAPPKTAAPLQPTGVTVTETEEPNSRVRLTVTVPEALCQKAWEKNVREISKSIQIDGFRKGDRVPEYLLVRHVGESNVKRQVLEDLLHTTLPQALDTVAGKALKDSEHIAQQADDLIDSFSPTASFQYDVTVDVIPSVAWKGERPWASLEVEVEVEDEAKGAEVVEANIRSRHKDLGSLRVSTQGTLKMGDVAVVDINAYRIQEDGSLGEPIYSATQKGFQFDTEEGLANLLPGFVESLIGIERAQTREYDLPFPDTWQQESLRGVKARFQVVCQEIFERDLPALEDAVAGKFIAGAASMDEVRQKLSEAWRCDWEQKRKQATMLALIDALADVCEMVVPHSLLEEQGRQMYGAKLIELQAGGRLSKDDATQLMTEDMVSNYLVAQKDKIERQVKQALAVQEVFRIENLSYTEEELNAEVQSAEAEFKAYGQEYDQKRVREQAAELLEGAKVLEWLQKHAKVTYITKSS